MNPAALLAVGAALLSGCHILLPYLPSARDSAADLSTVPQERGTDSIRADRGVPSGRCEFRTPGSTTPAFCEGFAAAFPPTGRTGPLDPAVWTVSRRSGIANIGQGLLNLWPTPHIDGCGSADPAPPPGDLRICNGRLYEASNDDGTVTILALSPMRPFDWKDRTGTVVFDVSADPSGVGMWLALWIVDQPTPVPSGLTFGTSQPPDIGNGFGFTLAECSSDASKTEVDAMVVVKNYVADNVPFQQAGCVTKGTTTPNHFEVRVSATRVEVWGSDPGKVETTLIASADVQLPLPGKGLVYLEDVHYNATPRNHTFAWDNVGFDGTPQPRNLAFDVPDNNEDGTTPNGTPGRSLGHRVNSTPTPFTIAGVHWSGQPAGAVMAFSWFPHDKSVPEVRLNGQSTVQPAWPFSEDMTHCWRSIAIPVPLNEVAQGTNTLEMKYQGSSGATIVSNISLVLIGAAPP